MKGTLLAIATMLGLSGPVLAAPWINPDDLRARHSLQRLVDLGCVDLPATTWPVMWADLSPQLDAVSSACRDSQAWRYLSFERDYQRDNTIQTHLTLAGSSETGLFKGFDNLPRDKGELSAGVEWTGGRWSMGLRGTWVADPFDDQEGRADGSYLATSLGNWAMGVGVLDRWWGPGWQSSTILGTNARPIPALFLNRRESRPFWGIGRWSAVGVIGQLESDRHVSRAKYLGARLVLRPSRHLEIGLSRAAVWGGEGRSQSLGTLWDAIIGKDNGQQGPGNDPSNQLGGADLRVSMPLGGQRLADGTRVNASTLGVYLQMTGEDEAGGLPSKFMGLAGLDLSTLLWGGEQRWFLEYTDTTAGAWSGESRPNIAYEHYIYRSGYRFNGRNIATTWEGDSQVYTLGVSHFFRSGRDLSLSFSHGTLNEDGTARSRSGVKGQASLLDLTEAVDISVLTASYRFVLAGGRMTLSAYYLDADDNEILDDWSRGAVSASWEFRFD